MGVVVRGGDLLLCAPDAPVRGVKLVTLHPHFIERYNRVTREHIAVQWALANCSKSLRPRKRKVRVRPADLLGTPAAAILVPSEEATA